MYLVYCNARHYTVYNIMLYEPLSVRIYYRAWRQLDGSIYRMNYIGSISIKPQVVAQAHTCTFFLIYCRQVPIYGLYVGWDETCFFVHLNLVIYVLYVLVVDSAGRLRQRDNVNCLIVVFFFKHCRVVVFPRKYGS